MILIDCLKIKRKKLPIFCLLDKFILNKIMINVKLGDFFLYLVRLKKINLKFPSSIIKIAKITFNDREKQLLLIILRELNWI